MIGPNSLPSSSLGPAFRVASASAELRAGGASASERFGDFSAFSAAGGDGQVGLGRATSSIDVDHAARQVADCITEA